MDLLKEANLDFKQVQVLTQALFALGHADGMDPREEALIRAFYEGNRPAHGSDYDTVVRTPFDLEVAKTLLKTTPERTTFLHTCFLVAFVDHKISAQERALLDSWAAGLGFSKEQASEVQSQVKDFLVGGLSKIRNTEAVLQVARKLV